MMQWIKRNKKPSILIVLTVLVLAQVVYGNLGWSRSDADVLNATKARFTIDGERIVAGKYEMTAGVGLHVYEQFRVTVENKSEICIIRVHGISRRHLRMIGPEMLVQSMEICGWREATPDEQEPEYWNSIY